MNKTEDQRDNVTANTVRLGGLPLSFFWQHARLPALVAAVVEIILIIANLEAVYLWTVNFVLFVGLVLWLRLQGKLTFAGALVIDAMAGLAVGVIVAIFRLLWERHLYLIFSLITEPLTIAAGGLLLGALAFAVFGPRPSKTVPKTPAAQMRKGVRNSA